GRVRGARPPRAARGQRGTWSARAERLRCAELAPRAGLSKADTKNVLDALEEVVLDQLGGAEKVKIGGGVQLTVRGKEATKARKGRNPATGEGITIAPKAASGAVKARPLAQAKAAPPS